jgi:hypothetical protein
MRKLVSANEMVGCWLLVALKDGPRPSPGVRRAFEQRSCEPANATCCAQQAAGRRIAASVVGCWLLEGPGVIARHAVPWRSIYTSSKALDGLLHSVRKDREDRYGLTDFVFGAANLRFAIAAIPLIFGVIPLLCLPAIRRAYAAQLTSIKELS